MLRLQILGERTSVIEPQMLAYVLASHGPSQATEETRLVKEEAYERSSQRSTTVMSEWYRVPFRPHAFTHTLLPKTSPSESVVHLSLGTSRYLPQKALS